MAAWLRDRLRLRDPQQRLRYLPRLVRLVWAVDPAATLLVALLSAGSGLIPVAEVHVLRRVVETAQQVVAGSAPLAAGLMWGAALAALGLLDAAGGQLLSVVG